MTDPVSVDRLVGQLGYLFEDQPELRKASAAQLRDLLDRNDRYARARAESPLDSDAEVAARAERLESHVTLEAVEQARARVSDDD
ncbi:MAG: hypothetical protein JWL73_2974 [Actinomycetia bacterium]|nr:hypothetical protein [Actinomycetes bacterium]